MEKITLVVDQAEERSRQGEMAERVAARTGAATLAPLSSPNRRVLRALHRLVARDIIARYHSQAAPPFYRSIGIRNITHIDTAILERAELKRRIVH